MRRSVIGMPLKTAVSRTCESPTKANRPWKSSPRVNPGISATPSCRPDPGPRRRTCPCPIPAAKAFRRTSAENVASTVRARSFHRSGRRSTRPRAPCLPATRPEYRSPQRRRIARPALDHRYSVQVAAILGRERRHERRLPARHEAVVPIERCRVHENRVLTNHSSSPAAQAISWIWTLPVTWHERGRKQASCRPAGASLRAAAGTLWIFPDLVPGADREAISGERQAHRTRKAAEMRVEAVSVGSDDDQLPRLVGGDQERNLELPQQGREARRVHAPQRRWL